MRQLLLINDHIPSKRHIAQKTTKITKVTNLDFFFVIFVAFCAKISSLQFLLLAKFARGVRSYGICPKMPVAISREVKSVY
jgi:hypothetical protein